MFVNNGQQKESGRFVLPKGGELPWGSDPPGTIILYDSEGNEQETKTFDAWGHYQLPFKQGETIFASLVSHHSMYTLSY